MSKTFDQGKDEIAKLCQYFATNREAFIAPTIKEAQVRQALIDPLFEALGWDVHNAQHNAPQYMEVIYNPSLDDEGERKEPDYAFRIGQTVKYFAEAKKCGVNINADPGPAYQLRRYGWSARVALSILTDYEELGVYDCTRRPRPGDKASCARIQYFRFEEYPDRWRELWDVFSREAVWSGAFDQYAASKRKRGTSEVDVEFLKEIEGWRDALARNIAIRNKDLSPDDLQAAVQLTIDRVVFLRMAEDRGIETYEQLLTLCERPDIYARFMRDLCRRADEKYNSGLFHFQKESGVSEPPDRITPDLTVDDKVFKPILQSLYFAHGSPYHFGVLPVEILGTVYERFLGKVIRLTAGHQAKVEEKPEVRKAGGVYYTPAYIVDYIVKQTVGRQIEGRSPAQLAGNVAQRLSAVERGNVAQRPSAVERGPQPGGAVPHKQPFRVLDMACGSGSFLLGAYRCLLDHCLKWCIEHKPETQKKAVYKDPRNGHWRLTIEEKKRILTTHIFGVDIDPQAVEVSKLSLLLKVLEGETDQTVAQQMRLFHDRALPNLSDNIKCGNSLIGPDYFTGRLIIDPDEMKRVNPFDWKQGFPEVFNVAQPPSAVDLDNSQAGAPVPHAGPGFECIIGNPPYGFHQIHDDAVKPYFRSHYRASEGSFEHYFLFYERSLSLLRKGGLHGFIVPVTWLTIPSAKSLRRFILDGYSVMKITWLPELVFKGAQVNTLISIIGRFPSSETVVDIHDKLGFLAPPAQTRRYAQKRFVEADHFIGIFEQKSETGTIEKMLACSEPLQVVARPCSGYNPYEVGKGERPGGGLHTKETVEAKPYHSERKRGKDWKPEIVGRDLQRYAVNVTGQRWIKYGPWLAAARDPDNFRGKRLLIQEITGGPSRRIIAVYFDGELYHSRDVIPIKLDEKLVHPFYLLGLINSWLMSWFHHRRNPKARKQLFPKVLVSDLRKLPIRRIDLGDEKDRADHDRMVTLVDCMLTLHRQLAAARSVAQREIIQRQIDATDAEIDRLVYDLYGLTPEEIAIVEGTNA
jgi:hypothetical protein